MKEEDYSALMAASDLGAFVDRLRTTSYGDGVTAAEARYEDPYDVLLSALKSGLVRDFSVIRGAVPEHGRDLVDTYLYLWDVHNLKAILRGIERRVSREEISGVVVPVGTLGEAALKTLVHAPDVPAVVGYLASWSDPYGRVLSPGLGAYQKNHSLAEMEIALDIFVYSRGLASTGRGANDRVVRDDLAIRIDGANVTTLLKTAGEGYSREGVGGLFIEGGTISRETYDFLSGFGKKKEIVYNLMERLPRRSAVRDALERTDPEDVTALEEAVFKAAEKRLSRLAVVDPLGIAAAASYMYMRVREVKNLRAIARGVAFGMPPEVMRDLLVMPSLN